MKHILDHPKTRDDATKLARFADLDRKTGDRPTAETETLVRAPRRRDASEKLKRFVGIARQGD
ncbi:hypothetical protein GQ651_10970 [Alphaproteobacteria bacterium GH1-50]|uniref:Uncharacterized protein n=1 Tax=Kangsaoukella pontilimi TaxID=2691042 RepID=A0A7C9IH06_9RHOB|nr:hypothetical protein [Kangsaoukella pontilimi]MXQ08367.1 hypothetical protein [Kangsaoukella pontilimi]